MLNQVTNLKITAIKLLQKNKISYNTWNLRGRMPWQNWPHGPCPCAFVFWTFGWRTPICGDGWGVLGWGLALFCNQKYQAF